MNAMNPAGAMRVSIVSDTVDDINGVALGLRRLVASANQAGHALRLIGAARGQAIPGDSVVRVPAAMSLSLPIYPEMIWSVPQLRAMVRCLAGAADLVQCATPGPMGFAGLLAGRLLGLPVIAQYHTEVAEYAARLTGIPLVRGIVEPLVAGFYRQADLCLAPSETVARRLLSLGVPEGRVWRVPRGVDLQRFHPRHRDRASLAAYGVGDGPLALYVGRLSVEKNLDLLLAAWQRVRSVHPDARLLFVGDGPQAHRMGGPGIVAAGPLFGERLATVFASADVFAFPSETETFGNVVVEAAASGLPAVVARAGAAHEHLLDGVTGTVVSAPGPAAFASALLALFDNPLRRRQMSRAAREHAARYDLDRAMRGTWEIYRRVLAEPVELKVAS